MFFDFVKRPRDYQLDIPRSEKWKIFGMLLLLEMAIIFIIVFPIYYLVNWITPLREVEFIEDFTLVKSLIFLVFLIPFLEEVLFRLILRYSGLVEAIISRGFCIVYSRIWFIVLH